MLQSVTQALRMLQGIGFGTPDPHATVVRLFEQYAAATPDRTFLRFEDKVFSYGEANALMNRHAHAYHELGIRKGDVVALVMENRPEFLWHLFGMHKVGVVASLINTNLFGDSLAHALRICRPRHVVVGSEVWKSVAEVRESLQELAADAYSIDLDPSGPQERVSGIWGDRLLGTLHSNPTDIADVQLSDQAAYIYTSGTTGLPKAAVISHLRFFRGGSVWAGLAFRHREGDVLYNCLPLYHANAVLLATSSVMSAGVTMALSRKFSRQRFWDEIRQHDASSFIYIGELCRYLVNHELTPRDRDHRVRVISGNGLRPDIWRNFQSRFGIDRIVEFYGSTEGNCITLNAMSIAESVGPKMPGMALARWDEEANAFVRDSKGYLVKAKRDEPGVLLGKIRPRAQFDGYQDREASERKIVRDAFTKGDAWFDTGDLLRCDKLNHLHFVDRLGDTYRWKGENVATSEVQERISSWPPAQEVNVYGVSVPGVEGRAGMAALVLTDGAPFDPAGLRAHVQAALSGPARPTFVRVMPELSTTSTFKLKKGDLQKEGFDPRTVTDPLYLLDPKQDQYVPLTEELYDKLVQGRVRL